MKIIEGIIVTYGLGLTAFFGLSFMAFWNNPIVASMEYLDGILLISGMVGGFFALVAYYYLRQGQIDNRNFLKQNQ